MLYGVAVVKIITAVGYSCLPWSYVYLIGVTATDNGLALSCGDEPDRPNSKGHCASHQYEAFAPYLEIFTAWRKDPDAVECPLVPVHQEGTGRTSFSLPGAFYDYPDLLNKAEPSHTNTSCTQSKETHPVAHVSVDGASFPD